MKAALLNMKKDKAHVIDGIPPELILNFWVELGAVILESLNIANEKGQFHRDINTAMISLIPKKGKYLTNCEHFRPISLIGTEIKIYAKALAMRLDKAHTS
jgi:hypothetical protein